MWTGALEGGDSNLPKCWGLTAWGSQPQVLDHSPQSSPVEQSSCLSNAQNV